MLKGSCLVSRQYTTPLRWVANPTRFLCHRLLWRGKDVSIAHLVDAHLDFLFLVFRLYREGPRIAGFVHVKVAFSRVLHRLIDSGEVLDNRPVRVQLERVVRCDIHARRGAPHRRKHQHFGGLLHGWRSGGGLFNVRRGASCGGRRFAFSSALTASPEKKNDT